MMVIREFSRTCAAVSFPLPVRLSQTSLPGLRTLKLSIPLGETFTSPSEPADPTKNKCCALINSVCLGSNCLNFSDTLLPPARDGKHPGPAPRRPAPGPIFHAAAAPFKNASIAMYVSTSNGMFDSAKSKNLHAILLTNACTRLCTILRKT